MLFFWKNKNKKPDASGANTSSENDDIYQEDINAKRGNKSSQGNGNTTDSDEYEKDSHKLQKDADKKIKQAAVESKYRIESEQQSDTKVSNKDDSSKLNKEKEIKGYERVEAKGADLTEEKELTPDGAVKEKGIEKVHDAVELKHEADFEVARQKFHASKGVLGGILSQLGEDTGLTKITAARYEEIMNGQQVTPRPEKARGYIKPQPDYPVPPLPGEKKE